MVPVLEKFGRQTLPTVEQSRVALGSDGPSLPLACVPWSSKGLLKELPEPPVGRTGWPWTVQSTPYHNLKAPVMSIVTPSFQQGRYLEETIRSVLLQNYPRLEYVVMDGGSTDETAEILQKYRPWLSFARSAKDAGQGNAINLGFSLVGGAIRGWLNSDDFYLPEALRVVGAAAESSRASFFYGDGITVDDVKGTRSYAFAPKVSSRYLHFGGLIFSHSAFWRTEIHQPIWETMRCNVDGELWLRLVPRKKLRYLPRPLGAVRIQPDAKTVHPKHRNAWAEDDAKIWAIHGNPPAPRSFLRYEYRYAQRVFASWRRCFGSDGRRAVLNACSWPEPIQDLP